MISVKFSCVTQGTIASSNKLHAIVRGSHAVPGGSLGLLWDIAWVVNINLEIYLSLETTLITYLVSHGDSVLPMRPKAWGNLANSIRRIQNHGF